MASGPLLASAALAVVPVGDQVLDPAARGVVTFANTANVASYQQDGLFTHRGRQYTAWYARDGRATVARRRLPRGRWERARLDYRLYDDDSHNAISMTVTPGDDRLHIAFPTHDDAIRYTRTRPGISRARRWRASLFERVRDSLPGAPHAPRSWTYPQFERVGGRTLLTYRDGTHDAGRQLLLRYGRGGRWSLLGRFTDSGGTWSSPYGASTSRYAYLHGFTANAARPRRLEIAFSWRELPAAACAPTAIGNHDIGYAASTDGGLTWRNDAGRLIARTGSDDPIAVGDPHVVVPVPIDRGLMNQESQATDSRGRFHVMTSVVPGADCVLDFYGERAAGARPQHSWRDLDGVWRTTPLPMLSGSAGRTKLVFDRRDDAFVVLPDGRIAAAHAATGWTDWRIVHDGDGIAPVNELVVDRQRIAYDGVLSIAYQERSPVRDAPSAFRVADFRLSR